MKWETKEPKVAKSYQRLTHGDISLSVAPPMGPESLAMCWQTFSIMFTVSTDTSVAEACQTFPREAIAEARKRLDEFEASLAKACD